MGRGKSWSREESQAVATAWKHASEHTSSTREQNSKAFVNDLYRRFTELAPSDPDVLDGRWTSRSQTAVKTQFDAISEDVNKFNIALSGVVEQAVRQGITSRDLVLRATVSKHLQAISGNLDFDSVKSEVSEWKLFEAWRVLSMCKRFAPANWPMSASPNEGHVEDSDEEPSAQPQSRGMDCGNSGYSIPSPRNLQSGGTPMRTLASAALSLNPVGNGMSSMTPLSQAAPNTHRAERRSSQHPGGRRGFAGRTLGKRHAEQEFRGQRVSKNHRAEKFEILTPNCGTLELVAQAISTLGDALSEHNAITLFSRPEMQGRSEQQEFFNALADKHVAKAKIDRDRLVNEVRQKRGNNKHESHSYPE